MNLSHFNKGGVKRRHFLKAITSAAALSGLPAWYLESNPLQAAENGGKDVRIALIGCGGQGRGVAKWASNFGKVVAVCDVDESNAAKALEMFAGAKVFKDFRKVVDSKEVDVIVNGTPDHWHTLINLAAMNRGKDVYSEKPLTLTIDEGRRVVAAARKTGRILQTGSQQRSDARFRLACELVRNGRLGKLTEVESYLPAGPRRGPFNAAPVPPQLDWEFWQGQTAKTEYVREKCHSSFRYWWEYSGGTMTDWGAHHNDIALWGMGLERSGPITVEGRPLVEMIPGGFTASSEYEVVYTYANGVKQICRSVANNRPDGSLATPVEQGKFGHGVRFIGPEGWIFVTRGKIEASKPELLSTPLGSDATKLYTSDDHMKNFMECVKSRKQPICEAEIGHRSVSVCHLGVIAMRLGRKLQWNPEKEQFEGDAEAQGHVAREMRKPYDYESMA
ncbi:MAG: Gfo/Idh/MocA family oxidoreductase [Verrucomicrobiota bacterium]|nr:Gfo/Idh/MocA family oxidoreductase [Verrucomicrobiota bacterium]